MTGKRSAVAAALLVGLSVLVAGCGSQVDRQTFLMANGLVAGGAASTVESGSSSTDTSAGDTGTADTVVGADSSGSQGTTVGSPKADTTVAPNPQQGPKSNCAGLKNQTGITNSTITIANASDISGPVPGLFQASRTATEAYVAYFNATSSICGRKLKLINLDSREDAGGDQQAYAQACEQAFAAVGSMSSFDMGGAKTAQDCGLPDIRSTAVNPERSQCTTCFAAQSVTQNHIPKAYPLWFKEHYPAASQHAAFLWVNQGAAATNAENWVAAWKKLGYKVDYTASIDVSEFNYTPYVQQMQQKGIRYVQYVGPYQYTIRLAQAMQQQGFKPDVFVQDPTVYDPGFVQSGGSAVNGIFVYLNIPPFEQAASNPEMSKYLAWIHQVDPNSQPNFYGVFSWSAAELFTQEAQALGGKLTRQSLIAKMRTVTNWTGNGITSVMHPGTSETGQCWLIIRLENGVWKEVSGKQFMCRGLIDSGLK